MVDITQDSHGSVGFGVSNLGLLCIMCTAHDSRDASGAQNKRAV